MTQHEDEIIEEALLILELRLRARAVFSDNDSLKDFLHLQSRGHSEDVFAVMYLDRKCQFIAYERQTAVDPRIVVARSQMNQAECVVLHHNHADGCSWPSLSDWNDAKRIEEALRLSNVSVLDHVITSAEGSFSMTERGFNKSGC